MASLKYRLTLRVMAKMVAKHGDAFNVMALRGMQGPPCPAPADVKGVRFEDCVLGGVPGERALPDGVDDASVPTILFLHGGAYVAASAANHRKLIGTLCRESGLTSWGVDYRLAPEHPFPAGLNDAVSAYKALLETRSPDQIIVSGESAGGGLALALLLRAKQEGLPMPRAVIAWWPWTDLTLSGASIKSNAGKDFITEPLCREAVEVYLAGQDPEEPLASPLFGDLSGFPPVFLQVGDRDLVADDSRRISQRFEEAGVSTTLHVWRHMGHAFATSGDDLKDSRRAIAQCADWVKQVLAH